MTDLIAIVQQGGVIAYPTEGVFGIGCDPTNEAAVHTILRLKNRPIEKGMLVIAADWQQVQHWVNVSQIPNLSELLASWPYATTYSFPKTDLAPSWVTGNHASIAIRLTQFPAARELCQQVGPLISTSLNKSGEPPLLTVAEVRAQFGEQLDYIVDAPVVTLDKPTAIIDAVTGVTLRQ